jgi:histidyl-tRNA synthetase
MAKPSIPSGTRDFGPEIMIRREWIFETIRSVFRKYGYLPIETPAMEKLSVLTGKYGEEGDRLIFKLLNNGNYLEKVPEESLIAAKQGGEAGAKKLISNISERALRYDLTVPFARFVVMNQTSLTFPFKRYQIQPVWRADNPQKNRYREFYQCDADVVGSDSLIYDAEFLCIYDEALSNMGMKTFTIEVNNRKILSGYAECIGETEKFSDICTAIDKWDKVGEVGVTKELLERGISEENIAKLLQIIGLEGTNEEKIAFLENTFAPESEGFKGVQELKEVFSIYENFDKYNANIAFNLRLARGLNYYTGTIYEVRAEGSSVNVSIGGGGRYDNLTGVFGLPGMSGIGISFGADRIYNVLEELNLFPENVQAGVKVLLINFGKETQNHCLQVLQKLRNANIPAELYPKNIKIGKQFEYADKKKIPFTLAIGTNEMESGLYKFKDLRKGEQKDATLAEVIALLNL